MRLLPRPTYANVVATLAIFIALGGISYAATNLPKNSVGTKQIKKNAVTAKKIKKKAVTTAKIKKNAVTTAKIKKNAVTEAKVDPNLLASIKEDARQKVLNGDGSVLGEYAGNFPAGPFVIFQVLIDGGLYTYYGSGQLIPLGSGSPSFKNNTCTGAAYLETDQNTFDLLFSKLGGGPSRVVYRAATGPGSFGPISAWQYTPASEDVVNLNLWEFDGGGNCVPTGSSPYTGLLAELESVPAPPDGVGPLKVG